MDDPYAALGIAKTATADEIKRAYRKLVKSSHPDLNPDDARADARFKAIAMAYELLKDPATRARYDAGEIDATGAEKPDRRYYRDFAEAPGNVYQRRGEFEGDPADIFADLLRQRGRGGGRSFGGEDFGAAGSDVHYTLEVPFLDAVLGGKTRITLPGGGALDMEIPPGSEEGRTLRLRGRGGQSKGGYPAGDAYVTLTVQPHPLFRRDGDDIHIELPITIDEAVLGGKVAVPTISGAVNLTIPKGVSSGRILRLRGRGVNRAGAQAGDQLVELRIVLPPVIDDKLKNFLQDWRETSRFDPRKDLF